MSVFKNMFKLQRLYNTHDVFAISLQYPALDTSPFVNSLKVGFGFCGHCLIFASIVLFKMTLTHIVFFKVTSSGLIMSFETYRLTMYCHEI